MKELEVVTLSLADEEKLEQLPVAIAKTKEDMKAPVHEAIRIHKSIKRSRGLPMRTKKRSMKLTRFTYV